MREKHLPFQKLREAQTPAFSQVEGRMLVSHKQRRVGWSSIGWLVFAYGDKTRLGYKTFAE